MRYYLISGLVGLACLAGCGAEPAPGLTATGDVHLAGPSQRYTVKSVQVPYELRRLSRIAVFITDETAPASEQSLGDLPFSGTGDADHVFDALVLKSLKSRRSYMVRLAAYMVDPALGPDPIRVDLNDAHQSETVFSTSSALPSVTFGAETELDLNTLMGGFTLTLKNQAFSGSAAGSLKGHDGILEHSGAESAISQEL